MSKYIELQYNRHITNLADRAAKETRGKVNIIVLPTRRAERHIYTITQLGVTVGTARMTNDGKYSIQLDVNKAEQDTLNAFTIGCTQEFS